MSFEFEFLDWLQTLHTPMLDRFFSTITHLGDAGILWILLAVILLVIPKTRKVGAAIAIALVIDLILCNGILKNLVARTRPFDINETVSLLIKAPTDFSFPSGHTAASFAAVAALFFSKEKWMWKVFGVIAIVIAFSRMYLYVHYPTDVLGGIFIGVFAGFAGWYIVTKLEGKFVSKKGR